MHAKEGRYAAASCGGNVSVPKPLHLSCREGTSDSDMMHYESAASHAAADALSWLGGVARRTGLEG